MPPSLKHWPPRSQRPPWRKPTSIASLGGGIAVRQILNYRGRCCSWSPPGSLPPACWQTMRWVSSGYWCRRSSAGTTNPSQTDRAVTTPALEPSRHAHLDLPDGRELAFEIRSSAKARSLRLKISARDGLVVIAPNGVERGRVMQLVVSKADWIAERLTEFDAVRHLVRDIPSVRPQAFDLPALAESWRVEYRPTRSQTVGARTDQAGRILVSGAIEDVEACQAALRRWLARHAKVALSSWLTNVAQQTGLRYTDLAVKNQRTRWGSCTAHGRVSLNCKLLFLPRELVRTPWKVIIPADSGRICASLSPEQIHCTVEYAMLGSSSPRGPSGDLEPCYEARETDERRPAKRYTALTNREGSPQIGSEIPFGGPWPISGPSADQAERQLKDE